MTQKEIIDHWIVSAEEDRKTAETLHTAAHYHWCLFLWHLSLEKLLKAKITSLGKEVPFTHNLEQLADAAGFTLDAGQREKLREITTFNLEARYDDYKLTFYRKAKKAYADTWIRECKAFYREIQKTL